MEWIELQIEGHKQTWINPAQITAIHTTMLKDMVVHLSDGQSFTLRSRGGLGYEALVNLLGMS